MILLALSSQGAFLGGVAAQGRSLQRAPPPRRQCSGWAKVWPFGLYFCNHVSHLDERWKGKDIFWVLFRRHRFPQQGRRPLLGPAISSTQEVCVCVAGALGPADGRSHFTFRFSPFLGFLSRARPLAPETSRSLGMEGHGKGEFDKAAYKKWPNLLQCMGKSTLSSF